MPQSQSIRVISRNSHLALAQVGEVFANFPDLDYSVLRVLSLGDKNKAISLFDSVPGDFFTRELDHAILNGEADIAIHSAKDLPYVLPNGLTILALTEAFEKTDSLVSKNKQTLKQLPAGSKVGTSSIARKNEILSLRSDLNVVSIRGTIEERLALIDDNIVDAIIVATCALKRLGLADRIAEILPFKTHPLQGHLAIVARDDNAHRFSLFETLDIRNRCGKISIVGFGPGDPNLLTLKAYKKLEEADVIYHDYLITPSYLDRFTAEKICVGKRKGHHCKSQEEINELLYQSALQGKNTVRLKGGDPMIFAHVGEEIGYLKDRHIQTEVLPGITTASAAAAEFSIPLTYRNISSSVTYLSGHSFEDIEIPASGTVVFYMAASSVKRIASTMIDKGWLENTKASLIYNASLPDQEERIFSLKEISESSEVYKTPLLIIIGDVVGLKVTKAEEIIKPSILVCGTESTQYKKFGRVIHQPLIKTNAVKSPICLKRSLNEYEWIIFTSKYTVEYFVHWLMKTNRDVRVLAHCKIASIGERTTAELKKHGICPDMQASEETSKGLVKNFKNYTSLQILLPRSDRALDMLPSGLHEAGHHIETAVFYETHSHVPTDPVKLEQIDFVALTSPSVAEAFLNVYESYHSGLRFIVRGETTLEYLKNKKFDLNKTYTYNDFIKQTYDKTPAIPNRR